MSLMQLLDEIRDDLRTLPSVRRVYEGVPDSVSEWPAIIVAATSGNMRLLSHDSNVSWTHQVRVEVHYPRKNLKDAVDRITAIAAEVAPRLYEGFVTDQYNGTMIVTGDPDTANNATSPLTYELGPSEWDSTETYAMVCDFRVTTIQEIAT